MFSPKWLVAKLTKQVKSALEIQDVYCAGKWWMGPHWTVHTKKPSATFMPFPKTKFLAKILSPLS